MRSLFRSFRTSVSDLWQRVRAPLATHKAPVFLALLVGIFFLVPEFGRAQSTLEGAGLTAVSAITYILAQIVTVLGNVFIFLVDIFLGFARYNSFGDAQPVNIGWVIVRDICNMFFIVILLLSAFSTIIGWNPALRYNQVLPKLLLMAILINFSRTFIQILVDLSQVVMLTFVNAFQAAGAGNFTAAFRINDLLSMRDNLGQSDIAGNAGNFDLVGQILASFILALVFMIIADGVMLIMVAFVLGRIIFLWVAIILSPAAFMVTALPSNLQGAMSGLSSKYWSRLSGVLAQGPVAMFFIYLTFAILQSPTPSAAGTPASPDSGSASTLAPAGSGGSGLAGSGNGLSGQLNLYQSTEGINTNSATTFLTRVGTSDNVASFIVAIALMLMAMEAATSAAESVSSEVGSFAKNVGGASKKIAAGVAVAAAKSPWFAAKLGYNTLDKRYDVTGKVSESLLWAANKVPVVGQFARKPLMAGITMRQRQAEKEAKDLMSDAEGMTADQKRLVQAGFRSVPGGMVKKLVDKGVGSLPSGALKNAAQSINDRVGNAWYSQGDRRASMALSQDLASDAVAAEDQRNEEDILEDAMNDNPAYDHLTKQEKADAASNQAAEIVRRRRAQELVNANTIAKSGDIRSHADISSTKKTMKEHMLFNQKGDMGLEDEKKLANEYKKIVDDPSKISALSADTRSRTETMARLLVAAGMATMDAEKFTLVEGKKNERERLISDLKSANAEFGGAFDDFIDDVDANEVKSADGTVHEKSITRQDALEGRMEKDSKGLLRIVESPRAEDTMLRTIGKAVGLSALGGVQAQSIDKTVGRFSPESGGRLHRNTSQLKAMADLKMLQSQGKMNTPEAGKALQAFLDSKGQFIDIAEGKGAIPGIEEAVKQSLDLLSQQLVRPDGVKILEDDGKGRLQMVHKDDPKKLGEDAAILESVLKQARHLALQTEGRMEQETLLSIAKAFANSKVAGNVGMSEIWASNATFEQISDKASQEAGLYLFSGMRDLTKNMTVSPSDRAIITASLAPAVQAKASRSSTDNRANSRVIRRVLDGPTK